MEAHIQRIKELTLPLDTMPNELDRMRILDLSVGLCSIGVEAEKAMQTAREGRLFELCIAFYKEGLPWEFCYDLYKQGMERQFEDSH